MVLQVFVLVLLIFHNITLVHSINDEGLALLSFRNSLENSTSGFLSNWNSSDVNPCSWNGIKCEESKVISLSIPSQGLAGNLHPDVGKLSVLQHINLRNNYLSGSLPAGLFNATGLKSLVLSGNSFSQSLPNEIGNLTYLQQLDLSDNSLNGSVPPSLVQCKRLKRLVLNQNRFTGSLPDTLGNNLVMLQNLNVSFNNFSGSIPGNLGNLSSLQGVLDLSHNFFNGSIPASLGNLSERVYIDLSYNNLSGPIPQNGALLDAGPTAFIGNALLCGPPLKTPCLGADRKPFAYEPKTSGKNKVRHGWSPRVMIATAVSTVVGIILIALMFSYWYKKAYISKKGKRTERSNSEDKSVIRKEMFCFRTDDLESLSENMEQYTFVPLDSRVNFDLEQLLKASAFLLGKSGTGIIYKVVLERGPTVAVRRLEDVGSQRFREFQNEVEAIAKIRHPNIVSLLAYSWCISEKLLIYEYIPNGDLATAFHGRTGMAYFKPLLWSVRVKIMKGIAKGLVFLHEHGPKRYVHGNLKPSNVLLGENMEPHISDFGLNRLAYTIEDSSSLAAQLEQQAASGTTSLQGSPYAFTPTPPNSRTTGSYYEAPEVSTKVTKPAQKWDVYSFGVILMEMVSGKSPALLMSISEMDLVKWVQLSIEVKPVSEILDPFLAQDLDKRNEMVSVLKIALACVNWSPDKRPSMRNVSDALERSSSN